MQRIVDGIVFEGKSLPDVWDVSLWETNGHREISMRQAIEWTEVCPEAMDWSKLPLWLRPEPNAEREAADAEEKRQANLARAAQRAKTQCRRFIKAMGLDEMLTLTYRENQTDERLFKEHFGKWIRRMKAALGGQFIFCAGFEPQERGAWHAHVACHKLPAFGKLGGVKVKSFELGTRIWRSVVGADNGLCFVGGKRKDGKRRRKMSVGKNAAYVSKYIVKHFELMPEGKNRYSRSNGMVPKPVKMRLYGVSLVDAIAEAFMQFPGEVILSHRIGHFKDSYYLCTEPDDLGASERLT